VQYAALKDKADKQEPLPSFRIRGAKLTFNLDATYTVVQTQLTRNVVGLVPGSDPRLKDTYLVYGAHYDHMGFSLVDTPARGRAGETAAPAQAASIGSSSADDDGSGSVALLAIASVSAGPRPKRSIRLVWFTGEERGLGSR
jgi:Zn-dependent M28 family amino/carboxypeptidase